MILRNGTKEPSSQIIISPPRSDKLSVTLFCMVSVTDETSVKIITKIASPVTVKAFRKARREMFCNAMFRISNKSGSPSHIIKNSCDT